MSELRDARRRTGLTQARAAELLGTSASNISAYESGRLAPGMSVRARMTALGAISPSSPYLTQPLMTAASTGAAIRRALRTGQYEWPLQLVAQSLADLRRVAGRSTDRSLYLSPPSGSGSRQWNALLAAAVSRECVRLGVDPPGWTKIRPLRQGWSPVPVRALRDFLVARTPPELARVGVWLDAGSLDVL